MTDPLRRWLFLVVFLACTPALSETITQPSRWIGQVDARTGRFGWPGSGLELGFFGTRLDIVLTDTGRNSLIVEHGGKVRRIDLAKGEKTYSLARDFENRAHRIKLLRRTEGLFGATGFIKATTDGRFFQVDAPDRQLLVIGDSISAGYGIEGRDRNCRFSADSQNHYLTFAAVAARRFAADVTTLAISGRGLSRNYDGSTHKIMPELIDRLVSDRKPVRNWPRDTVSVIVVHLGTNDFGGGYRPVGFVAKYAAFLNELRTNSPKAVIYAAIGPMLDRAGFKAASRAIESAVTTRRAAGDTSLRFLVFPPGQQSYGCDWHPNAKTHRQMADLLAAAIERDLKWTAR